MQIETKSEFIKIIFELLDENDAIEWENDSAYDCLQALAAWLDDRADVDPTWQLFAEALQAAKGRNTYTR